MSTPEGRVKDQVKKLLAQFKPQLYAHWPVMNGMGMPALDCHTGSINGRSFAIETKALGKKLTARQEQTAAEMRLAGIKVFEVDGSDESMKELRAWLAERWVRGVIEEGL